ncbi:MAG TPA: dephospho-CoA kinase [Lachnospiraceae bacterium]|nr:dephospho-CoA kinase [Lachnospiraceae bacterium]
MKVIGITGGIGSGKSRVMNYIAEKRGVYILEADRLAKSLMNKGERIYMAVTEAFGEEILDESGEIDRIALAGIVFNDPDKLSLLNQLTHPAVREEIINLIDLADQGFIRNERHEKIDIFMIEAALLIEEGYKEICDHMIFVYTDRDIRIKRLMEGRGYTTEKCLAVMNNQKDDAFYRDNSDIVIDNSYDFEMTERIIDDIFKNYIYNC